MVINHQQTYFNVSYLRCAFIKERFHFNDSPLSDEEKDFPLAYGILVHRWYIQVYYLLSAIYHPQNAYCIVIDNKTSRKFKQTIFLLGECFRNVQVIVSEGICFLFSID
ncbi:unnamed protein product [Anisakis simplex]|uniref:Uncharacterized protein n=1 Tax=Anisakis simplex TaxID=6269 RepID=A0A0M3K857_ANISI|nr:unnamed protein product [Anisakis simplex]